MNNNKYIITIAVGKKLYVDMAINLAMSFLYWHPNTDIKFQLATDQPSIIPLFLKNKIQIIIIKPGELGVGFSPKLYLDKLICDGQTLFIDSDCLIYGNLNIVFNKFNGHQVSVIGKYISKGEWFGNVEMICKKFNINHLPKFNGGIYYLEKGLCTSKVYETARLLEKDYDKIGFIRLRNCPNDELLMSLSMELNQQKPIDDDGSILAEFVNFQSGIKSDLIKGKVELYNSQSNPLFQKDWHLTKATPLIVHFLGHHNQIMPYIKEVSHMRYIFQSNLPILLIRILTSLQISFPFFVIKSFKNSFRSLYHTLFGARKIKTSQREIIND